MNSYLGILKHYNTYKLRKRIIFKHLSCWWGNHVFLSGGIAKFVLKTRAVKKGKVTGFTVIPAIPVRNFVLANGFNSTSAAPTTTTASLSTPAML